MNQDFEAQTFKSTESPGAAGDHSRYVEKGGDGHDTTGIAIAKQGNIIPTTGDKKGHDKMGILGILPLRYVRPFDSGYIYIATTECVG